MIINVPGLDEAFEPIAAGTYPAQITNIEEVESRSGRPMINVELTIADGPYTGRKLFDRFLKDHPVGVRRFGRMLRAARVHYQGESVDTQDIIGRYLLVVVAHEENPETGDPVERVVRYAPRS